MKILVAYATRYRSTAEIAEFMGDVLREHGFEVTVEDCDNIVSIQGYDAFVIGTPVYTGTWLPTMQLFVQRYQDALFAKPVYCFMTCIHVLEDNGEAHARRFYIPAHLLKQFTLRDCAVFPGKLNLQDVDWQERWTISVRYAGVNSPTAMNGDFRDWVVMKQWIQRVARQVTSSADSASL